MQPPSTLPDEPDASTPVSEGHSTWTIPSTGETSSTYYKIIGDLHKEGAPPPVVIIHGGPCAGHQYMIPFWNMYGSYGVPVIFYDQIGCGKSSHSADKAKDVSFWTFELFVAELDALLAHLGISERFCLLGHSHGTTVAAEFCLRRQPKGLQRLVLWSAHADKRLVRSELRRLLYEDAAGAEWFLKRFEEAEAKEDWNAPGYKDAESLLYRKHITRADPLPKYLMDGLQNKDEVSVIRRTM